MEVGGLINAMTRNIPLCIGIDSKSTVDKATRLQEAAILRCESTSPHWWLWRNPCKRPWSLQTDGDLWQLYWEGLLARGPRTIAIRKVKGHATMQHVADGVATLEEKVGNDTADLYAGQGIREHGYKRDFAGARCRFVPFTKRRSVSIE